MAEKKGFFSKLFGRLDKKLEAKSKEKCCCREDSKSKDSNSKKKCS